LPVAFKRVNDKKMIFKLSFIFSFEFGVLIWSAVSRDSRDKSRRRNGLRINFPTSFHHDEWNSLAKPDEALINCKNRTVWQQYLRAQDSVDQWLYENFFFGMKEGLTLESGASDGWTLSSTSFFERYVSWRAVHVGKLID